MNGRMDDTHRYDDIINQQHPVSKNHPPMPMENRAAQFLPFAALAGYDAAILETARLTNQKIELDEDDKLLLSSKLQLIQDSIQSRPEVKVTYFEPDERKAGGAYVVAAGCVQKVDIYERYIVMSTGRRIPIDEVCAIEGELFQGLEEPMP